MVLFLSRPPFCDRVLLSIFWTLMCPPATQQQPRALDSRGYCHSYHMSKSHRSNQIKSNRMKLSLQECKYIISCIRKRHAHFQTAVVPGISCLYLVRGMVQPPIDVARGTWQQHASRLNLQNLTSITVSYRFQIMKLHRGTGFKISVALYQ